MEARRGALPAQAGKYPNECQLTFGFLQSAHGQDCDCSPPDRPVYDRGEIAPRGDNGDPLARNMEVLMDLRALDR